MKRDGFISRRHVLHVVGGSAVTLAAGCLGTDDPGRNGDGARTDSPTEDPTDGGTGTEPSGNETGSTDVEEGPGTDGDGVEPNETDGNESDSTDGNGGDGTDDNETDGTDGGDGGDTGEGSAIDESVDIVVSAATSGWEGVEPESIAGERNPTLVLEAGAEYSVTWENADGKPHNIEIWNEREEVVGGHATELVSEEGETQSIEFVASEEMVEYACKIHFEWGHRAPIEVVPPE